jgi:hypothetical protein
MIDWVLTARFAGAAAAVLALALCASYVLTVVALRRLRRAALADAEAVNRGFRALGAEVAQLAAANLALREYLVSLSERVDRSQQTVAAQAEPATGRAYELAARLAAAGAPATELIANCGLSRAEADLAVLVHGTRPRAGAAH